MRRARSVLAVATSALLLTSCAAPSPLSKATLADLIERAPGVGFPLPSELPPAYRFVGPWQQVSDGSQTILRSAHFAAVPATSGPVVEWCLEVDPTRRGCIGDAGDARVTRRNGSALVTVRFIDSPAVPDNVAQFWRDVGIVDFKAVSWLPD